MFRVDSVYAAQLDVLEAQEDLHSSSTRRTHIPGKKQQELIREVKETFGSWEGHNLSLRYQNSSGTEAMP